MQRFILSASILLSAIAGFCQEPDISKPRFFTKIAILCPIEYSSLTRPEGLDYNTSINIAGNDTTFRATVYSKVGFAFDIVQPVGNFYVIKLWPYSRKPADHTTLSADQAIETSADISSAAFFLKTPMAIPGKNDFKANANGLSDKQIDFTKGFYLIRKSDLESQSKEFDYKLNKWNLGVLVLPVKARPFATSSGNFDFEPSFNLGLSFSMTIRHNWISDYSVNWLISAGVASIKMDSVKSGGTVSSTQPNISAFTFGTGVMFEKSSVQISLLTGLDFPSGQTQKKWVYRNMPWIGIGFGFSLFKLQSSDNTTTSKAQPSTP